MEFCTKGPIFAHYNKTTVGHLKLPAQGSALAGSQCKLGLEPSKLPSKAQLGPA